MRMEGRMCMGGKLPFVGMVMVILVQVTNMMISKVAISSGMSNFIIVVYSNAFAILILLPSSLFFHRSDHLPLLNFSILCRVFMLAVSGTVSQISAYAGLKYSSATLGTALLNLIPAFTFILAIIFGMEMLDWRSSGTKAKFGGTVVSILGAFIVTLYEGPPIVSVHFLSGGSFHHQLQLQLLLSPQQNWIIGGFIFSLDALATSFWYIIQASILKIYPAELIIVFYFCLFVTIQSAVVALIAERNLNSWRLRADMGLFAILYSAIIGNFFRLTLTAWCLRKTSPLYVSMFKPLAVIVAIILGVIFQGDVLYLGSLVGAVITVIGFYAVMWGKAKEEKLGIIQDGDVGSSVSSSPKLPLLQNKIEEA